MKKLSYMLFLIAAGCSVDGGCEVRPAVHSVSITKDGKTNEVSIVANYRIRQYVGDYRVIEFFSVDKPSFNQGVCWFTDINDNRINMMGNIIIEELK